MYIKILKYIYSISLSNLSGGAQTALNASSSVGAGISIVNGVNSVGSTSYNVASGASAVTSSGSSSSSSTVSVGRAFGIGGTLNKSQENFSTLDIRNTFNQNFTPINITSADGAKFAIENITSAIEYVSSMRATLGAMENRLEFTINSLAARSRIVDANMAVESAQLVKKQILSQAGNFVLSAAFRYKNVALGLLQ